MFSTLISTLFLCLTYFLQFFGDITNAQGFNSSSRIRSKVFVALFQISIDSIESDLIGGLFGFDLDQINERSNENGMAVGVAETPLLKQDRHHKAYEI
jgi:hypothetical protein